MLERPPASPEARHVRVHAAGFSMLAAAESAAHVSRLHLQASLDAPVVALLDVSLTNPDTLAGGVTLRAALPPLCILITGMTTMHEDVAALPRVNGRSSACCGKG